MPFPGEADGRGRPQLGHGTITGRPLCLGRGEEPLRWRGGDNQNEHKESEREREIERERERERRESVYSGRTRQILIPIAASGYKRQSKL